MANFGCQGSDVTITPLDPTPKDSVPSTPITPYAAGQEFVNSSAQMKTTSGGRYKVSLSLGDIGSQIKATTSNGTKVFSNVQGQILSR